MNQNYRAVLILLVLLAILLFLVGFRLGKHVERLDKSYVPPPTPTNTVLPTPTEKPFELAEFEHEECGISFLYPKGFEEKVSSDEAKLTNNTSSISLSCNTNSIKNAREKIKDLEQSEIIKILGTSVKVYEKEKSRIWIVFNAQNGKSIAFETSPNLLDLVVKSMEF